MAANSSLLGSWRHLLLVWAAQGDLGDSPLQGDMCLTPCCPQSKVPNSTARCLWRAPGRSGQPSHGVHLHQLQNKGHVAETQCRAKFKFPGCQQIHISKKYSFTKCDAVNLKASRLESSSSSMAVGPNATLTCGPLHTGRALHPWGPQSHPSSLTSANKAYFLSNKQKKKY